MKLPLTTRSVMVFDLFLAATGYNHVMGRSYPTLIPSRFLISDNDSLYELKRMLHIAEVWASASITKIRLKSIPFVTNR